MDLTEEEKDELIIINAEWTEREGANEKEKEREKRNRRIKSTEEKLVKILEGEEDKIAFFLGFIRASIIAEINTSGYKKIESSIWSILKERLIILLRKESVDEAEVKKRITDAVDKVITQKESTIETIKEILKRI